MAINPLTDVSAYLLRQISASDVRELGQRLTQLSLRPMEAIVLQIVEVNPNITQVSVGRMLGIAAPNMCPLITKLAMQGLLERQPRGRRTVGLRLTSHGMKLARRVSKIIADHEAEFLARIPATHRRSFIAALHALWSLDGASPI